MPRFIEAFPNHGVDELNQWMMVPLEGFNVVVLADGAGLAPSYSRTRLKVEEVKGSATTRRTFKVTGKATGFSVIKMRDDRGKARATLSVSVKTKLMIDTAFHLVRLTKTNVFTKVTSAQVDDFVDYANGILEPQANVEVVKQSVGVVTLDVASISYSPFRNSTSSTWSEMVKKINPHAAVNVFFVHELNVERAVNLGFWRSDGKIVGNEIAIPDSVQNSPHRAGRTLAHEVSHWLGNTDQFRSPTDELMTEGVSGMRLRRAHADIMNP